MPSGAAQQPFFSTNVNNITDEELIDCDAKHIYNLDRPFRPRERTYGEDFSISRK